MVGYGSETICSTDIYTVMYATMSPWMRVMMRMRIEDEDGAATDTK